MSTATKDLIRALAEAQRDYIVRARRHIHQHPELSFEERETAAYVAAELRAAGLEPEEGVGGGYGVVATLDGGRPGPTLAFRADMDALPVQETVDLPFRSQNAGVMHACGHDAHTAVLLGAARALAGAREQVAGRVRFLFQPAEELPPGGALPMIEAGCLDGVDQVYGLHQSPMNEAGHMTFGPGPRQASSDTFRLTVLGRGGHGAMPDTTIDAIQITGQLIGALHQIVARRVPPHEPAVLTLGTVQGGTKENVIAHEVALTGTVRALSERVRRAIHDEMEAVSAGITRAWGGDYRLDYLWGYPVLVNDPAMTERARRAAEAVLDPDTVHVSTRPIMPAEDFARYLEIVPGSFASLGVGTPGGDMRPTTHSGAFLLDESGLHLGVAWYLALAFGEGG